MLLILQGFQRYWKMLLLFETPGGFALFKVLDEGKLSKVEVIIFCKSVSVCCLVFEKSEDNRVMFAWLFMCYSFWSGECMYLCYTYWGQFKFFFSCLSNNWRLEQLWFSVRFSLVYFSAQIVQYYFFIFVPKLIVHLCLLLQDLGKEFSSPDSARKVLNLM